MAKRYSKFHSNYILRKKHQETLKGTIWERDWVTIGAQHQLEKGKRVFYGDTNFLFTDNSFNSYKKRHQFSKWIGEWNYDDAISTASNEVNVVEPNWESNDLRDFAYYGSCVDLIKNAVFDIVKWFPGRMVIGEDNLYVGEKYSTLSEITEDGLEPILYTSGKILQNPFGLDLYRNIYDQITDENPKRYVYDTYYEYEVNGEGIIQYEVIKLPTDCIGREIVKVCQIAILTENNKLYFVDGYDVFGTVVYVEGDAPYNLYYTSVDSETGEYSKIYSSQFGVYTDTVYIHNDDLNKVYVLVQDVVDEDSGETQTEIVTFDNNDGQYEYALYGYARSDDESGNVLISVDDYEKLSDGEKEEYEPRYYLPISVEDYENNDYSDLPEGTYFALNIVDGGMLDNGIDPFFGELGRIQTLQEQTINVREFVENLHGIERLLLNNKTNPLYRAALKTPIETDNGYLYSEKFYTWPSSDGYIDVGSVLYEQYIDSLIKIATIFDDTWCDNLWRNMTHESIRNFDWTYTKDYIEGDEEAFIEGGKRVQDVLHVYGIIVDELKRYIDGIKMTGIVTYDGYNNMASAEMTDKLAYRGWDVFSVIPVLGDKNDTEIEGEEKINNYDFSTVRIDESFIKSNIQKQQEFITEADYSRLPDESRVNYTFNYIRVSYEENAGEFYDAISTDIIMADEYEKLTDDQKELYKKRYQDAIISAEKYDQLDNDEKEKYAVYEYIDIFDEAVNNGERTSGHILTHAEYDSIIWQEDYIWNGSSYCLKGDDETCAVPLRTISTTEYNSLRYGKDKYIPYTYYKLNEIYEKDDIVGDELLPYIISYDGTDYLVNSFYPSKYGNGEETISIYDYNKKEWQEDYFAFEYFIPDTEVVTPWQEQAITDGLVSYSWESVALLDDEERKKYQPYRYLNIIDRDTTITPEQWSTLETKKDWKVVEYTYTLDKDVVIPADKYKEGITKYIKYNVITPSEYDLLSSTEKMNFAAYYPMRIFGFDRWFNARNFAAETMAEQDIRFAKELMLLSKEIFATKGTRQGIDMIMSMFGFGDTYTLTEKYHFIDIDNHMYDEITYANLQMASVYDDTGIYEESDNNDDEFRDNTVPMGTVELHDIDYIIPYFSDKKKYAGGDVYFQAKGGWGSKTRTLFNQPYDFMETLSYLRVVETVGDLLNVNARTVRNGDIYYVLSLIDLVEYDASPSEPEKISHFFYLADDFNPHLYRSWVNIDMTDDENAMTKTAKYLDGIVSTSIGNNPHTGYGNYDLGQMYLEYVKKPFKYYLDNYVLDSDIRNVMDGESASFNVIDKTTTDLNGKIKNVADCEAYNPSNPLAEPIDKSGRFVDKSDIEIDGKQYYINDKTLIITNKINNNLYKKYFFDVIVHYLMQMIPSTTILILENFNIENDQP